LPYDDIRDFVKDLQSRVGVAAAALEFLLWTAGRTDEVIRARWPEIDPNSRLWTVPGERMKGNREHRVPLSAPALAVLERMRGQGEEFIFPGLKDGKPLSNMAMLNLIGRMNGDRAQSGQARYIDPRQDNAEVTPHGFRSTFRDWAAERTNFPNEIVEMAIAHAIDGKVEAAYRRGDLFDKRRRLMDAWAEFCAKKVDQAGTVLRLRQA
jgi:integrase